MISCTEFIPVYSLLFEFLDAKNGHDEVNRYWNYISDNSISNGLGKLVEKMGIAGCWKYYNEAHTSEAADVTLTFDEEEQVMTIDMHYCPSKGKLLKLPQMKPYYDYCGHCLVIYKKVLNRYGIDEVRDHSHIDEARCFRTFRVRKPTHTDSNTKSECDMKPAEL